MVDVYKQWKIIRGLLDKAAKLEDWEEFENLLDSAKEFSNQAMLLKIQAKHKSDKR